MEKSFAFNSINKDRVYKAEDFASYFASFIGNGIFPNPASQLQVVDNNDMTVTVKEGKAWINGYYYQNTNEFILKLDPADSVLNRIDRVVLRLDFNKRAINLSIKKGEFSSNAQAKKLQRDADAYEIALADIKVSKGAISISQQDITDLRLNKNLCGIVHGVVDQVDTTAIFNQFESWYSQTKDNYDKDIATWTKEKKETFEKWYIENTNNFTRQFEVWFKNTEIWEKDFTTWLDKIKEVLNGNVAGNLLNKIDKNTKMINDLKNDIDTKEQSVKDSIDNLKSHVDNGKGNLYSAIVGKKVTPRSKDFKDLTEAVTDIKLGQGNAQASEVLRGKTFTNDSGVEQVGTMPNMGSIDITPKTYTQELETGYYNNIKIKGINDLNENEINNFIDVIANKLSKGNSKKANIFNGHKIELESCGLGGLEKTKDVELNLPFEPKFIISEMVEANKAFKPYRFFVVYDSNGSYEIYNENSGYDVSISIRLYKYNRTISWYNHSKNYRKYPKINLYFYDKFPFDLDIDINKYLK